MHTMACKQKWVCVYVHKPLATFGSLYRVQSAFYGKGEFPGLICVCGLQCFDQHLFYGYQGAFVLTWINFNHNMDKDLLPL